MDARSTRASLPLLCATVATLAACADATGPSDVDFRRALEPVVADAFCRPLPLGRILREGAGGDAAFPLIVPAEPFRLDDHRARRASVLATLDQAVAAGLLTRTEGETRGTQEGMEERPTARRTISYAPTDAGSRYFRGVEARTLGGGTGVFPNVCGAAGEIVDVVRWTEPADVGGRRVSRVTYSYRGVEPIPLGSAADRAEAGAPRERTVPMELTSDGWRVMPR